MNTRPSRRRRSSGRHSLGRAWKRRDLWEILPASILLAVALLLGGSANPLGDMIIEWLAVAVLAIAFIRFDRTDWGRARPGLIVIAIAAGVALIELTPLPYTLWRALPGRQSAADLLEMLSLGGSARPVSLDPNATISSLLQIIPGIAAFVCTIASAREGRRIFVNVVIAGALVSVLVGVLQITGQSEFYFYRETHLGNVTGVFANRDHAADMLLIGIALLAARFKDKHSNSPALKVILAPMIFVTAITVVLTASRFAISLMILGLVITCSSFQGLAGRFKPFVIPAILIVGALGVWLLMFSAPVSETFGRFNDLPIDLRPQIWRHTLQAIGGYWPIGSGLGTFVPVYQTVESMDGITFQIINHAHNEYLEIILELGILGVALIASYLFALGLRFFQDFRTAGADFVVSVVGLAVLLFHSTVDFPLRNEALMVTFGVLNGLVFGAVRNKPVDNT